jgi:ACS family hexuronate transporter-like MFS transporter
VKRALGGAVLLWSAAGILHSWASDWKQLAAVRLLLGFAESAGPVGGAKAIGEWTPRSERGLSMAIFSNGLVTGAVLAPPLVAYLSIRFGWRAAFVVTGSLGLLWLLVWRSCYDSPDKHRRLTPEERKIIVRGRADAAAGGSGLAAVLHNPNTYAVFLARFLTDPVPYFFTFWLPEYLRESRHFSLALIGMVAWIPFLAADVGGLSGGTISDWLVRRQNDPVRARRRLMFFAACLTPAAAIAVRANSATVALACIGLVLAAHSCWTVNLQTFMTENFARNQVGTVIGFSGVGSGLGGICATLVTGRLIVSHGYVPVFTLLAIVHLAGFTVLTIFQHCAARRSSRGEVSS